MGKHVPVTASLTTDSRSVFGLEEGEIGLRFSKEYSATHSEREVIRLTRAELLSAFCTIGKFLVETDDEH